MGNTKPELSRMSFQELLQRALGSTPGTKTMHDRPADVVSSAGELVERHRGTDVYHIGIGRIIEIKHFVSPGRRGIIAVEIDAPDMFERYQRWLLGEGGFYTPNRNSPLVAKSENREHWGEEAYEVHRQKVWEVLGKK